MLVLTHKYRHVAVYIPTMYNVYNSKLARGFISYTKSLQVIISSNIAIFFECRINQSYANSRGPGEEPCSVATLFAILHNMHMRAGVL